MASLKISNTPRHQTTPVSNIFIEQYMPQANGTFVKVYLYGLHYCYHQLYETSTKDIAQALDLLESDVIKAFEYWQSKGLLLLEQSDEENVHIAYQVPTEIESAPIEEDTDQSVSVTDTPDSDQAPVMRFESKPQYNPQELSIYMQEPEINQLFKIAERYLGRMLNHNDLSTLYSFYDWLRLPVPVIEILLEHCISNNHRSMRYMEKVALNWADDGVNTVEKAQARAHVFSKNYREIMKSFGLTQRDPAPAELDYMKKWLNDYEFPLSVILEACKRTIEQTHQPSFPYADSILTSWHKNNVKSSEDIVKQDEAHNQKKLLQSKNRINGNSASSSSQEYYSRPSKFVNFKQREWDFDELERLEQEYLDKKLSEGRKTP